MTENLALNEPFDRLPIEAGGPALIREIRDHLAAMERLLPVLEDVLGTQSDPPETNVRSRLTVVGPTRLLLARLTERERQVIDLLVEGFSNRQISRTLRISESTTKNHLHSVYLKLEVTDRTQAVAKVLAASGPWRNGGRRGA